MNKFPLKFKISLCLLILVAASTLFLFKNKPIETNDILVKVNYVDSENLVKVSPYPHEIELRVTGTKENIGLLKDSSCNIDLSKGVKGINRIFIRKENLKLPKGVNVIRIAPDFINVHLETRAYKRVPVNVVITGKSASGYWLIAKTAQPDYVLLSGPSHVISKISKISTKPIDITNAKDSFKKEVILDLAENVLNRSGKIYASFDIKEKIIIKKIKGIPVKGRGTKRSYKIMPNIVEIEIKAPESLVRLNNFKEKIKVYIDLKGLKKGIYVRRAAISIPLNFTLVKAKPANFTVNIN